MKYYLGYDVAPQHNGLECAEPLTTCGTYHHVAMYDMLLALVVFYIFMNLKKRYEFGPGSWMDYGQFGTEYKDRS